MIYINGIVNNPTVTTTGSNITTYSLPNTGVSPRAINKMTVYGVENQDLLLHVDNLMTNTTNISSVSHGAISGNDFVYNGAAGTFDLKISYGFLEFTQTMKIAAANAGNGVTRKVLYIGDSLTDAGVTTVRMNDNFSGDVMNVDFVGTQDTASVRNEGYSGKTYNWFLNDGNSPFVISGSFNFPQYLTDNSISLATDDWVIIQLGTNDIYGNPAKSDAALDLVIADAHTLVNAIKAAVPGIRIAICTVHATATQDAAWINNYGINGAAIKLAFWDSQLRFNNKLRNSFDGQVSGVSLVPYHYILDGGVDYPEDGGGVQINALHPTGQGTLGYNKLAKSMYYFLKNNE